MKRIIQKTIVALMFVCATSGAWAGVRKLGTDSEELLAFWPNFSSETLTSGTYTLTNFREATLDNGVITIDSSSGLALSNSTDTATWSGNGRGITIMLNYSNFAPKNSDSTQSDNAVLIATSLAGLHDSAIGLFSNSSGTTKGFWYNNGNGVGWKPGANTFTETTINAADELFFEYDYATANKDGNGVYVYKVASDGTGSEVYHATGLRSNVNVGKCVNIGCSSHGDNTWYLAKKMKVHSVAIFYRTLTEAQRKAFALTRKIDVTSTCNFADLTAFKDLGDNDANWNAGTNLCIRVPSTATDTVTLTLPAGGINTGSLLHIQVAAGKTLVLTGGTATAANIIVEGAGTLSVSSATALAGTIKGGGTVAYTGCLPSGVIFTNDAWTGTVELQSQTINAINFSSYGNANSTVCANGLTCYPALNNNDHGAVGTIEIGAGGLTFNDKYHSQRSVFSASLTGSGPIHVNTTQGDGEKLNQFIFTGDVSGFSGSIDFSTSPSWKSPQVVFTDQLSNAPAQPTTGKNSSNEDYAKIFVTATARNATIGSSATWTAANGVIVDGALKFCGTGLVSGPVITSNGSTLDFSEATSDTRISGVLTLASGTTIKLPAGAPLPYQIATSGSGYVENVTVQIGNETLVIGTVALRNGKITTLTAVDIDTEKTYTVAETLGSPSATSSYEINVTADATLNLGADTTVDVVKFNIAEGKTLTITGNTLTADLIAVDGGGTLAFDVSNYNCKTLARNAVKGAPYYIWPGNFASVTGNATIDTSSVQVPIGYSYQVVTTPKGPVLELTTDRQFGSLNINFCGMDGYYWHTNARVSDNAAYSGLMHGATPVVGTSWNDVNAQNATDTAISKYVKQDGSVASDGTVTITLSQVNNPHDVKTTPGDQILYGYCDDSQSPIVTIKNIPFAKYRVIAYAATDTPNSTFCPKTINGVSYSTAAPGSSATPTVAGGTGAWGDSNSRSTLAEGVNYLVSDVISGTTTVTINNPKTDLGRAAIPAVQIVEVGVDNSYDIDSADTYTLGTIFPSLSADLAYEINVNESATLNIASAATVGKIFFNVASGKTLTLTGSATLTATQSIVFDGEGKVETSGALRLSGVLEGPGTFKVSNVTYNNFRMIGESGKLIFTGVSGFGYAVAGTTNNRDGGTLELIDNGDTKALTLSNGYGGFRAVFDALTGTGTFKSSDAHRHTYVFKDASAFEGTIELSTGAQTKVILGDDTESTPDDGSITIPSGAEATIKTGKIWSAVGGMNVLGTLKVEGTGSAVANVTAQSSAIIDLSAFTGETPAIDGSFTLADGMTLKLPAGADLSTGYALATGGDAGITEITLKIGDADAATAVVCMEGGTITTANVITVTENQNLGALAADGMYMVYVTADATITLDSDISDVGFIKFKVSPGVVLKLDESFHSLNCPYELISDSLTIADNKARTFTSVAGAPEVYQRIGTLSSSGSSIVVDANGLAAGNYTLARWVTPQQYTTLCAGYGKVATLSVSNLGSGLEAELIYGVKDITLRIYNATTQAARKPLVIWPYGDSITEGFNGQHTGANYRILLYQKLRLLGYNVKSAGVYDKDDGYNSVDPTGTALTDDYKWHSAKHGATAGPTTNYKRSNLCENVDTLCAQVGTPDVVLLHIGVNDLNESINNSSKDSEIVNGTFEAWTNVVRRLVTNLPNTKIIVSTALDGLASTRATLNGRVATYNGLIKDFMENLPSDMIGHVYLADLNACVDSQTPGILYTNGNDNLHPDWWGHDQMAEGWLTEIVKLYDDPDATDFPSQAAIPAIPESSALGAANKSELASYRAGFTRYGNISVAHGQDIENIDYENTTGTAATDNLGRVGYFVEYVRDDNHAHRWVWVDMDASGSTIGDVGLPTATHQQVVTNLHVYSNHNAIDNVAADDDTVKGFIEFTPFDVERTESSVDGAPADNGSNQMDWNDTPKATGTYGTMQVFRKAPPSGRPAQTIFGFNNWRSANSNPAEFGIGNFSQHFGSGNSYQTFDYYDTRTLAKMNADAYTVKTIEVWTKPVYTAPMAADSNFGSLSFSPSLPGDISACDLIINVTDNATLTFNSEVSVGSIKFNIAENKTLKLASTSNLTVGKVTVNGPGKLQFNSSATCGRMEVASSTTLEFATDATLTVSGSLLVASGATLTLEPNAITTASSTVLSATSISGSVSLTLPEEAGVEYSTLATDTSYKLVRTPVASFSYDGTIGSKPTGWGVPTGDSADWKYEALSKQLRIGPNSDMKLVYETCDGNYSSSDCKKNSSFSIALYADVSKVTSSGKAVLLCLGSKTASMVVLYRQGDYVKVGNWIGNGFSGDWEASVPLAAGFHLYTATFNFEDGTIALYRDDGTGTSCTSSGTPAASITLPTGDASSGLQLGCAWDNSGNDFVKGANMALASIRGYDAVLGADNVAKLAESFPATANEVSWDVDLLQHNKLLTVYSTTLTEGHYLGGNYGTVTIPSGETVNVPALRFFNRPYYDYLTFNMAGCINITTESPKDVYNYQRYTAMRGSLLGHYHGYGTYNLTGTLNSPNAYVELAFTAEKQTFNVDSGLATVKGFFSANGQAEINLTNNGTIEVYDIPNDTAQITKNFGYGTYRVLADATETQAINFNATSAAQPTTLDPYGNIMTLSAAAVTGTGSITVNSTAEGETKGKVVFQGSTDYTGTVYINGTNKSQIEFSDISAFTGNINYSAAGAVMSDLSGFTGTITFDGASTFDARNIDLSAATVVLANGATLQVRVGQEGTATVASGTTLQLYVTTDQYHYEGNVLKGTSSGTVEYYHGTEVDFSDYTKVIDANSLNGANLLPYYQIWKVVGDATEGSITTAANWGGNKVPTERADSTYGNAAFYVESGTVTVNVDATMTFGEIQVYGSGTVVFKTDGTHYLSANYLSMTTGVRVELSGTVAEDGAVLIIADGEILADSNTQTITIGGGAAMVMEDVDFSAKLICSGKLTTYGDVDMSTTSQKFNYGSQLTVATGTAKVQVEVQGFQGAITVASGATLKNVTDADAMRYSATASEPTLVDVSGTLDMGDTRWSLSTYNPIIFRDGATLVGTGNSSNGGFDWIDNATGCSLTIEGDLATEMKFKIRGGAEVSFDIASGKTLTHTGGWTGGSSGQLKLTGGRIITNSQPANKVDIASTATFTLQNAPWDSNPVEFTGSGILEFSATSSDYGNTVSGITTGNFTGKVKMTNSANKKCNFNPSGAATFTAAPEFVLEANNTHIAGWYDNNANHPFEVKNLSGSGSFKSEWNGNAHSIIVKTTQTRDTEFSGMFSSSHDSGDRVMNLTVVGDNSGDVHSLTLSAGQNTSSTDTAQAASRLTVSDGAKVVFTSAGGWGYGAVSIGNGGWLQSTNATAVTKLTLTDGANIVLPTSSSTLTGITSLTFTSGNTWITFADGVPAVDTVLIDWTGASLESAPAGYFKFADSSLNATYYLEKSTTGLTLKAVVKIDDGATHEVGYIDPNNGAATITNAVANVIVPASSTGLLTVLNGTSVTYNYSGSNITDANKGSAVLAFATDANGQIILGTPITSLCTVTVADGKITVALDESKVAPNPVTDDETNPPMAMTADSVVFALPMKAGLWYSIESGSSVDGSGNIVGGTLSTPQYSSSTSTQTLSIGFSGTVKYFKPAVAASKAALVTPPSAE